MFVYSNVNDLVDIVFSNPARDPCSYQIFPANQNTNADKAVTMFPVLMDILVKGAKRLYGEDITPQTLSSTQFKILHKYIASLGYNVKHSFTAFDGQHSLVNVWFEPIQDNRLTDCHGKKRFM